MNGRMVEHHKTVVSRGAERGFTLIEIAAAVMLLGLAFTTLVGLQAMYADRAVVDRNLTQAALASQYVLTAWETARQQPAPGQNDQPLGDMLAKLGYFEDLPAGAPTEESFTGWTLFSNITPIDIFDRKDALRRVELTIRWSDQLRDSYSLMYFMRVSERRPGRSPED